MFAASTPTSKLRGDAPEFVPGKPYEGETQEPKTDRGWMIVSST